MKFLTTEQQDRIRKCYSGMDADNFLKLSPRRQNQFMDVLDEVVADIVMESPDLFMGSLVKQIAKRRK